MHLRVIVLAADRAPDGYWGKVRTQRVWVPEEPNVYRNELTFWIVSPEGATGCAPNGARFLFELRFYKHAAPNGAIGAIQPVSGKGTELS